MATTVKIGQRFPLTIKRLDINGAGIGYYQRKITFVTGALPGEVVVAEVTAIHDRYLEAKTHKIRSASSDRVTPTEPLFGQIGGVELNHLAYRSCDSNAMLSPKLWPNSNRLAGNIMI